jgi:hypothetical protein
MLPIVLMLQGCGSIFSDFMIVNGSNGDISDVVVSVERKQWNLGDLPRAHHKRFYAYLAGEGGPKISWTFEGRRHSEYGCYYTGWMPSKGTLTLVGSAIKHRCHS